MSWALTDQYSTAVIFSGTFALTFLIWSQVSKSKQKGSGKLPPSIMSLPLVGSMPFMPGLETFHTFFLEKSYKLGDVIGFNSINVYGVMLNSHEAIREVLVKQSIESADRPHVSGNDYLNPNYKGILDSMYHSDFKKYHQLSLSILKEFGFGQNIMELRINAEVEDLVDNFRGISGAPVDPKHLIAKSVLSVISSIAIGDRLEDKKTSESLAKGVDDMFLCSNDIYTVEYIQSLKYLPSFQRSLKKMVSAQDAIMNLIDEKISLYLSTDPSVTPPPESFISSFISREGENFDLEQLKFTLRDFLLAGYETSSTTMTWFLLMMANYPKVQERLQKDLDAVVPRTRLPSLDDKTKMPYLEAVILEVMRIHTLVLSGLPHCCTEEIKVNGYTLPKGTMIYINIYAAHMSKKVWPDPEVFRPERFLNEDQTKVINKDKVIAFSLGKRSCLGELLARQEIYLFVSGLLHNFIVRPPEGVEKITVGEFMAVTLQPTPFELRFLPRN